MSMIDLFRERLVKLTDQIHPSLVTRRHMIEISFHARCEIYVHDIREVLGEQVIYDLPGLSGDQSPLFP